jgi:SAM-dependent methyltransferase
MSQDRPDVFAKPDTFAGWDVDYYTPIAQRYYDRQVARMLGLLRVPPGGLVLDAGCGPGVHAIRAARAGCRVQAIDISAVALRQAAARVAQAGVAERVTFEQADLTFLPFGDGSYRYIFSWGVLIHIPGVGQALAELARVLASGGRLAMYVLNRAALDPKLEWCIRALRRKPQPDSETLPLGTRTWYVLHGERLCVWRFDTAALRRYLARLGLQCVARWPGVLTEAQRRLRGRPRDALLWLNNLYALKSVRRPRGDEPVGVRETGGRKVE